ncbi:adenylate cyclase [Schizosaccharomyces japonicus yFS275]|uniref:Adenylate cyclase n=1 Tax=Schizosaccharomyces japonicus (strain yFS275 / FY16936) TaxID=402676 RepID=B6K065_SCHJY|nr:adenylate cyclase [Schizosaccharomyces japonicus yFS275]EEB06215.1 adenylate cyclase [Schizosaccharomyces japonicus yFS275]
MFSPPSSSFKTGIPWLDVSDSEDESGDEHMNPSGFFGKSYSDLSPNYEAFSPLTTPKSVKNSVSQGRVPASSHDNDSDDYFYSRSPRAVSPTGKQSSDFSRQSSFASSSSLGKSPVSEHSANGFSFKNLSFDHNIPMDSSSSTEEIETSEPDRQGEYSDREAQKLFSEGTSTPAQTDGSQTPTSNWVYGDASDLSGIHGRGSYDDSSLGTDSLLGDTDSLKNLMSIPNHNHTTAENIPSDEYWEPPESWGTIKPYDQSHEFTPHVYTKPKEPEDTQPFQLRIYRADKSVVSFTCPMNIRAHEVIRIVAQRFFLPYPAPYYLLLVFFNRERILLPDERPCYIYKNFLKDFGYDFNYRDSPETNDDFGIARFVFTTMDIGASLGKKVPRFTSYENIDVSGLNLEVLPVKLHRHAAEIRKLNVADNLSLKIPNDFLEACTNLEVLNLSGNMRLPEGKSIVSLKKLKVLNISLNDLYEVNPELLAETKATNLRKLYCSSNKLFFLPYPLLYLSRLTYLDLSFNNFTTVPISLVEITTLQHLDMSYNYLLYIPPEIKRLKELKTFYFQFNSVYGVLPEEFGSLNKLETIDLRNNKISDISSLSGCSRLKQIFASGNPISQHESSLSNAVRLDLSHCPMTIFDVPTSETTPLRYLDLSYGKIVTINPSTIQCWSQLEYLNLSYNHFNALPGVFSEMINLKRLLCTNCEISEISPDIGKLKHLELLDLHSNNLKHVPEEIWMIPSLTEVNLSSNILEQILLPAPKPTERAVHRLRLVRTLSGRSLSGSDFDQHSIPPVRELLLVDNRLSDTCFATLRKFKHLRLLNLSYNYITEIPKGFAEKLSNLQRFYISGNRLSKLPIVELQRLNLELLYVNSNRLTQMIFEDTPFPSLLALDLSNNNLQTVNVGRDTQASTTRVYTKLRYFNLSGNPWLAPFKRRREHQRKELINVLNKIRVLSLLDIEENVFTSTTDILNRIVRTGNTEDKLLSYGVCDSFGTNMDALSSVELVIKEFLGPMSSLYCVLDSGSPTESAAKVLRFVYDNLPQCLAEELSNHYSSTEWIFRAIKNAFLNLNKLLALAFYDDLHSKGGEIDQGPKRYVKKGYFFDKSCVDYGCSVILVYLRDTRAFIANAGTAEAIISKRTDSEPTAISKPHSSNDPMEIRRVIDQGQGSSSNVEFIRKYEVTRGVGYLSQVPFVISDPFITVENLSELNDFIVLANSNLWKVLSTHALIDIVRSNYRSPMLSASKVRDFALAYNSKEPFTVVVIDLKRRFGTQTPVIPKLGERGTMKEEEEAALNLQALHNLPDDSALARLSKEVSPPRGCIAMVFTDIKNSTQLWERHPVAMRSAIKTHNTIMRRQLRATGGYEVKTEGDAFMVCFQTVPAALLWCFSVQLQLLSADWPKEIVESIHGREILGERNEPLYRGLSVRIGVNWGVTVSEMDPITRRMDYYGPMVNRTARIVAVADGGQIAISNDVVNALQQLDSENAPSERSYETEMELRSLKQMGYVVHYMGEYKLKGLENPERISLIYPLALEGRLERILKKSSSGVQTSFDKGIVNRPRSRSNSLRPIIGRLSESRSVSEDYRRRSVSSLRGETFSDPNLRFPAGIFDNSLYQHLLELCERLEDSAALLHGYPEAPECSIGLAAPETIGEEFAMLYRLTLRIENTIYCLRKMLRNI